MITYIICGSISYLVIGAILGGLYGRISEDEDEFYMGMVTYFWPLALLLVLVCGLVCGPFLLAQYISEG